LLAAIFAFVVAAPALAADWGQATVDPLSLAKEDLAAESRGDVAAALALYNDDALLQYGGLCWTPCVGKVAIQKEIERRVAAKNEWKIIGSYVSGNVAVVQTELKIGFIEYTGVDHVVVWCIYEVVGDKIATVRLVGQLTDPGTERFVQYGKPAK
jgi:hypothetical protein